MGEWLTDEQTRTFLRTRQHATEHRFKVRHRDRIRVENRLFEQRRRQKNPEYINEIARKSLWRKRHPNFTPSLYNRMFLDRSGCCDICQLPAEKPLNLDHDHNTGAIRGLLCMRCNLQLGWYEQFSESVLEYLK